MYRYLIRQPDIPPWHWRVLTHLDDELDLVPVHLLAVLLELLVRDLVPTGQQPGEGRPLPRNRLHLEEPLDLVLGVLDADEGAAAPKTKKNKLAMSLLRMQIPTRMDEETIKTQNPKCRLYWCLIDFIDWRYSQACWYFRPLL